MCDHALQYHSLMLTIMCRRTICAQILGVSVLHHPSPLLEMLRLTKQATYSCRTLDHTSERLGLLHMKAVATPMYCVSEQTQTSAFRSICIMFSQQTVLLPTISSPAKVRKCREAMSNVCSITNLTSRPVHTTSDSGRSRKSRRKDRFEPQKDSGAGGVGEDHLRLLVCAVRLSRQGRQALQILRRKDGLERTTEARGAGWVGSWDY